jgi:hypothetical protein
MPPPSDVAGFSDGGQPYSGVAIDVNGRVYGTAVDEGAFGYESEDASSMSNECRDRERSCWDIQLEGRELEWMRAARILFHTRPHPKNPWRRPSVLAPQAN